MSKIKKIKKDPRVKGKFWSDVEISFDLLQKICSDNNIKFSVHHSKIKIEDKVFQGKEFREALEYIVQLQTEKGKFKKGKTISFYEWRLKNNER